MTIDESGLIYSTSLISKAFFWINIDNANPSNKKFKVFLFPNRIVIGSVEPQNVMMKPGFESNVFNEEKTIILSDLKEIRVVTNSRIFKRTYLILKNNETRYINWFSDELEVFLVNLTALMPQLKITRSSLSQEQMKAKMKLLILVSAIVMVLVAIAYGFYRFYFNTLFS